MEKGLQNGLQCILRDIDFKQKSGEVHPTPSNERGCKTPSHTLSPHLVACAAPFKPLDFSPPPPVNNPSGSSPAVVKFHYIDLNPIQLSRICVYVIHGALWLPNNIKFL